MEEEKKAPEAATTPAKSESGYGKKSWGKWIMIYVVIAIVVYGVIYYMMANNSSDSIYDTTTTTEDTTVQ